MAKEVVRMAKRVTRVRIEVVGVASGVAMLAGRQRNPHMKSGDISESQTTLRLPPFSSSSLTLKQKKS